MGSLVRLSMGFFTLVYSHPSTVSRKLKQFLRRLFSLIVTVPGQNKLCYRKFRGELQGSQGQDSLPRLWTQSSSLGEVVVT